MSASETALPEDKTLLLVEDDKPFRERLAREGLEIETSPSPQDFAAFIRKEIPFWAKVVRESGATAD